MSSRAGELFATLPWDHWRRRRWSNYAVMRDATHGVPGIKLVPFKPDDDLCPFTFAFTCDTHCRREQIRSHLIAHKVYPAVLWPIQDNSTREMVEATELSSRILCLPCDFRYETTDMLHVADLVRAAAVEQMKEEPWAA